MLAPTIDRIEDRPDEAKVLIPEVRRQTRRRRLWIGIAAVLAAVLLALVATGIAQANGATRTPAPLISQGRAATAAAHNCNDWVSQLDQGHGDQAFAVQASYASTAGDVAAWEQARDGTGPGSGPFASAPPSELLTVCFITGPFGSGTMPSPPIGNGMHINNGADVFEILPSGYAVVDVEVNGTTVPYSPPATTSSVQRLSGPLH